MKRPAPITLVELEKIRYAATYRLSDTLLDHLDDFRGEKNPLNHWVEIFLRGFVYGENESLRHQVVKYPRDWWHAFKERWFPKWLLKRYPVTYHIVELDVKAIYPEITVKLPQHEHRLIISRMDSFEPQNYYEE